MRQYSQYFFGNVISWFKDLAALSLLQIVTMAMPVLMIPFLAASLGKEQLGQLAFMQAIAFYIALTIEFGMDFSGTRYVSKNRLKQKKISNYFFSVVFLKLLVATPIFIIFILSALIFNEFNISTLTCCLLIGLFQGLNINWFFQGIEKVRTVCITESLIKTCTSLLIIYQCIHNDITVYGTLLLLAISNTLTFLFSYALVLKQITYSKPTSKHLKYVYNSSVKLFFFKLLSNTYSSGGVIVLGVFAPIEYAGFYAYADKIIRSIRSATLPLTRLVFSKISHLSKQQIYSSSLYATSIMVTINVFLGLVIYFNSESIVELLFGNGWGEVNILLDYMVILLPVLGFNTSVTTFYLMPMGEDGFLIRLISIFSIIYCAISPYLVSHYYDLGALVSLAVVEVSIMALLFLKFKFSDSQERQNK